MTLVASSVSNMQLCFEIFMVYKCTSYRNDFVLPLYFIVCYYNLFAALRTGSFTYKLLNVYYSFKIFPHFWLVKTTCIIHHNQLLLTKNFVILNQWLNIVVHCRLLNHWRQNDVKSVARCRLLNHWCQRLLNHWPRKPAEFFISYSAFFNNCYLLYRHECFTGKYTTHKIHTKPHPGLEWRIFYILTSVQRYGQVY